MSKFDFGFKSKERRAELDRLALEKYNNQYSCDNYGRFPWDIELQRGQDFKKDSKKPLSLTKTGLGEFTYEVLMRHGDITNFYCFWVGNRAAVYPRIWLTLEARDDFVKNTAYYANPPPVAHLN